jgi:hypothetical protein
MRAADVQLQVYVAVELTPDECPDGIANLLADAVRDYLEQCEAAMAALVTADIRRAQIDPLTGDYQ